MKKPLDLPFIHLGSTAALYENTFNLTIHYAANKKCRCSGNPEAILIALLATEA